MYYTVVNLMKCEYGVILITLSITCLYFLTINTETETFNCDSTTIDFSIKILSF